MVTLQRAVDMVKDKCNNYESKIAKSLDLYKQKFNQ